MDYGCGSVPFAEFLVSNGANIKKFDIESIVNSGNVEMVKFLIDKGINLEAKNAIYYAVKSKQTPILNFLLKENYTPNLICPRWTISITPLMKAIQNEDILSVKMLVEAGAKTNSMNTKGETVLLLAILSKNDEILNYIINNNTKDNFKDDQEVIRIVQICIKNDLAEILQKLIDKGLDISKLSIADFLESDNVETIRVLMNYNINLNTLNPKGQTPLYVAFKKRYYKVVNLLLENGSRY